MYSYEPTHVNSQVLSAVV